MKSDRPTLLVLPSLTVGVAGNSAIRLTAKFIEGMMQYCELWPGIVRAMLEPDRSPSSGNLDDRWLEPEKLPFELVVEPYSRQALAREVARADVVLGGADHRLRAVPHLCKKSGTKYVFVAEYSLRTRWQIIDASKPPLILRLRKKLWELGQECWNRRHVRAADAVQCNGTPTYEAYAPLSKNCLLYFDTRVTESMIPARPSILDRLESLKHGSPLSLAFSGRLSAMKGVTHLPRIAASLKARNVPFRLSIFGDGPLRVAIEAEIKSRGIEQEVQLRGSVDFESRLMPEMRSSIDLFICPHIQGDPSCTYMETLACGVPIVGYLNEAFAGILRREDVGWGVEIGAIDQLCDAVRKLQKRPAEIALKAQSALSAGSRHTMHSEFRIRMRQIIDLDL